MRQYHVLMVPPPLHFIAVVVVLLLRPDMSRAQQNGDKAPDLLAGTWDEPKMYVWLTGAK